MGFNQANLPSLYMSFTCVCLNLTVDLNIKRSHYVTLYRHVAAENRSQCGRCVGLDSGLFPFHVCHIAKEVTCTTNSL